MTNPKLAVSASVVRYLLALDALKGAGGIRTTDVARYLNIKKPSAHTMLNNLKDADILLCDEPTGALDYKTSKEILDLIERVKKKYGNTVILVTHNDAIKRMADRVIRLRDGAIRSDEENTEKLGAMQLDW